MKKLTRFCSMLFALLTSVSVAACGGGGGDGEDAGDALTVEYLKAGYGTEVFTELSKAFMAKNSDITVKLYPNENIGSDTETKLTTNKNLHDVYYYPSWASVRRWAIKGWIMDISDVYQATNGDGVKVVDAMRDYAVNSCRSNDRYWALPNESRSAGFVYNSKLLRENGWSVPNTTDELKELCEDIIDANLKVTVNGETKTVKPIIYGGAANDGYWGAILETWWLQCSGTEKLDTFSKFESAEIYKDEGRLSALKELERFAFAGKEYYQANHMSYDANKTQIEFLSGAGVMMPCGDWFETEMKAWLEYYPDIEYKMMLTPTAMDAVGKNKDEQGNEIRYMMDSSDACWFVPKSTKKADAAKKWMTFLSTKEACEIWTRYAGTVRCYDYDVSPDSELYKNSSVFTQSLLELDENAVKYKYITESPMTINSYVGKWPQQDSPYIAMKKSIRAQTYYDNDYTYVNDNWKKWQDMLGL